MKLFLAALFVLLPLSASANIEFISKADWPVGERQDLILDSVGTLASNSAQLSVTLNFEHGKQLKLTNTDAQAGLALIPLQGKCVRVIPGLHWQTAALITNCN